MRSAGVWVGGWRGEFLVFTFIVLFVFYDFGILYVVLVETFVCSVDIVNLIKFRVGFGRVYFY